MLNKHDVDYGIYLVTDRKILGRRGLVQSIIEAAQGGATVVQLREKELLTGEFYSVAKRVKEVTDELGIPLIINDRLDIALAVDAAGLHIGQEDMPAKIARKLLGPHKILGVSASSVEEAVLAQQEGADYVGAGAVFATGTKEDISFIGLEGLRKIKQSVAVPVVAIGGISEENLKAVFENGADGAACVSGILGASDIKKAVEKLKNIKRSVK